MDKNSNNKKTLQDAKLAPTKGVRRPGGQKPAPQKDTPTFRRAAAPRTKQTRDDENMEQQVFGLFGKKSRWESAGKLSKTNGGIRKPGQKISMDVDDVDFNDTPKPQQSRSDTSKVALKKRNKWNTKIKNSSSAPKLLIVLLLMVVVVFCSAFFSYTYLVDKYSNPITIESIELDPETSVSFKIEKGSSTKDIAANLKENNLISSPFLYKFLSKFNGFDGMYKAGTYTLCKDLSYDEIMVILSSNPESVKITIPEGFTTEQIAARLEANKVCSAKAFLEAVEKQDLSSYTFITNHKGRDHRLDGYLFPDTYEFDIDASPETIIYKMLNRFNEIYTPEFHTKAESIGLTQDEVIILASLVEEEARVASERAKIAGVFINRLNSKTYKKLQSCATVKYAYYNIYGKNLETVTVQNTNIANPYNTYKYDGLPPGPISNPGKASIEAVLNYAQHDYYFFVVKSDGSNGHTFSRTYDQHVAAQGF